MPNFPCLPADAHLSDVFRRFPIGVRPLLEYHDELLRSEDGALSIAQRELIAAYVSGLNQCRFCFGAHSLTARAFGVDEALFETLHEDLQSAPLEETMKALLGYVKVLTESPARVSPELAQGVLDAGWSEDALYEAVSVCALYNLMNRIVEGAGIVPGAAYTNPSPEDIERRAQGTYMGWGKACGIVD